MATHSAAMKRDPPLLVQSAAEAVTADAMIHLERGALLEFGDTAEITGYIS